LNTLSTTNARILSDHLNSTRKILRNENNQITTVATATAGVTVATGGLVAAAGGVSYGVGYGIGTIKIQGHSIHDRIGDGLYAAGSGVYHAGATVGGGVYYAGAAVGGGVYNYWFGNK
jgi:hypothetical protein